MEKMAKANGGKIPPRIDELVAQYLELRRRAEEIKQEYEEKVRPFKETMHKIEMRFLAFLDATGQQSARTGAGTVYVDTKHNPSCHSPDEFMTFVFKHNLPELLNRHANGPACIAYAHEHGALPPGV